MSETLQTDNRTLLERMVALQNESKWSTEDQIVLTARRNVLASEMDINQIDIDNEVQNIMTNEDLFPPNVKLSPDAAELLLAAGWEMESGKRLERERQQNQLRNNIAEIRQYLIDSNLVSGVGTSTKIHKLNESIKSTIEIGQTLYSNRQQEQVSV